MINIVEDLLSEYGLRVLHVIDFTGPVKIAELEEKIPIECRELTTYYPGVDHDLKMFHLHAAWQARELVDFSRVREVPAARKIATAQTQRLAMTGKAEVRYGVLWYIAKGETMSASIELAAAMYQAQVGWMPTVVWMRKRPAGAPETYEMVIEEGKVLNLPLQEGTWVPERFIVAGIPVSELELVWKDGKFEEVTK